MRLLRLEDPGASRGPAAPPPAERLRLREGSILSRSDDTPTAIYVVHRGALKTVAAFPDGRHQVVDFHLPGELVGLDALGAPDHATEVQALHDAEVCAIPFGRLHSMSAQLASVQQTVHRCIGDHIVRLQAHIARMVGGVDQRVAAFLLELAQRQPQAAAAPNEVVLPMTRGDIGSYLGISIESVSRAFTRLASRGMVSVEGRRITLLDEISLRWVARRRGR